MRQLRDGNYWSPYLAGAFAGLVLVLSVFMTGNYFGASTSFARSAGLIEQIFSAERVARIEYFTKTTPKIDWQWMFVIGILIGSFIAAKNFRDLQGTDYSRHVAGKNSARMLPCEELSPLSAAQWQCSAPVSPMADHPVTG